MKKTFLFFVILLTTMMSSILKVSAATVLVTPTVGTSTNTTRGFVANWTAVSNATSYNVTVYQDGTSTVITTKNVTGATTATASITGLTAASAYQFTVTAVGDGTNFITSAESAKSATISTLSTTLAPPSTILSASRLTYSGFTANWLPVANATTYDVRVYNSSLVQVGSTVTVTPSGSTTLSGIVNAAGGLLLPNTTYTYTLSACDDNTVPTYFNSPESSQSSSFTTVATTGSFLFQYAAADIMTLNSDLKGGAADIYELTESGGAYTFSTGSTSNNNSLVRSTIIRAAAGLATKPVLKLNSSTTGATCNLFYTNSANMTLRLDGLDLNGINSGSGTTGQPMLFYGGPLSTNCSVYITNSVIHDFQNSGGGGIIRYDGITAAAPTGVIDIQGSTIYNFSGRAIQLNQLTTGDATSVSINLKNNTFYNNNLQNSRSAIIYNYAASGKWSGTITINHCTFNNILLAADGIIRQTTVATGGTIAISNCIFTTVPVPLTTIATVNYCYLAGFTGTPTPTGTNSYSASTAPVYTDITNSNKANYNFRLTNPGSFICGDGLVAGNTYNTTLAAPTVSAGGNNISSTGFNANWTPVANAVSYDVYLYLASSLISTTNVTGQAASSLAFTALSASTTYTYKVVAKGDGIYYFNSSLSVESAPITTSVDLGTGLTQPESPNVINITGKTIISSEIGTMQVYNLQGAVLLLKNNVSVVNSGLENGIYIVRFTNKAGRQLIQKIAIQ